MPDDRSFLLSIDEVAAHLVVSRDFVYRHARAGTIPHIRVGSLYRFRREDIDAYVAAHTVQAGKNCADVEAYVVRLVSSAPPLTAEQRDRLARLLGGTQ